MTVCIAGVCQDNDAPRIVFCCDTKVTDPHGATQGAKGYGIGHGWEAMLAGLWPGCNHLARRLKESFAALSGPLTEDQVLDTAYRTAEAFLDSPAYDQNVEHSLLLTGFLAGGMALIAPVSVYGRRVDVSPLFEYWAVGAGAGVARAVLAERDYNMGMSWREALYYLYEAKRFSENVPDVGKGTISGIQSPPLNTQEPFVRANVLLTSDTGLDFMKAAYQSFGPQPVSLKNFPDDFFFPSQ